jgi:hypothetical protein
MRQRLTVIIKREGVGTHGERHEAILYVNELPRVLQRGKNKAGKRRQGKHPRYASVE